MLTGCTKDAYGMHGAIAYWVQRLRLGGGGAGH